MNRKDGVQQDKKPSGQSEPRIVLRGLMRLARFDRRGLDDFGLGAEAVLGSLAPAGGFALAVALLLTMNHAPRMGLGYLLQSITLLLTPLVLSELLAKFWGREAQWARYAAVFVWSQWVLVFAGAILLLAVQAVIAAGMEEEDAAALFILLLAAYGVALQCFLAHAALDISASKVALLVLLTNVGTAVLAFGPVQLARLAATGTFLPVMPGHSG